MFCSNCGKQINDGAAFCANCGQKVGVQNNIQPNVINQPVAYNQQPTQKKQVQVLDKAKGVFEKIKKFRLPRMNVDYSSKAFKFAMIILLSLELGDFITYLLPLYSNSINRYLCYTIELAVKILLFGIFTAAAFLPLLKKARVAYRQKRSNVIAVLWGTLIIAKIVVVILSATMSDYKITNCFSNPMLIINIVNIALVITTLLYLFKNRTKNILMPIISILVWQLYADGLGGLSYLKMIVSLATLDYRIGEDTLFGAIFAWNLEVLDFGMFAIPILIILSIIIRYLFSHNTSKGIIISLCSFVFAVNMLDTVLNSSDLDISYIFDYVDYIIYIFLIVLFALSFVKTKTSKNESLGKTSFKTVFKRGIITSIISVATAFVLILSGLIVSGAVTASYINKNIEQWTAFAKVGHSHNATQEHWDNFTSSIGKSDDLLLTKNFISWDDYENYELINENYSTMEDIAICYKAYSGNYFRDPLDDEIVSDIKSAGYRIDEDWQNNDILVGYYELYQEMQPSIDNVSVDVTINTNSDKIIVTVTNKNKLPLSSCTIDCDFTLLFVTDSSYSRNEYCDGSRTITVEDIPANETKKTEIPFDPDAIYDGYDHYYFYSLWESDAEIVSIK